MCRTCQTCSEHARHAHMLPPSSIPVSVGLFAVGPYTIYLSPFAVHRSHADSLLDHSYYRQPFTIPGDTTYRSPIGPHRLTDRHSLFAVLYLSAAVCSLPIAVRSQSLVLGMCAMAGGRRSGSGSVWEQGR
ncbi:hypothetical protein HOY80DRAFT_959590 [Tuber brumale]|nr:hypothetical protein HOY80DRAFT_959590 [Tuber brumale]